MSDLDKKIFELKLAAKQITKNAKKLKKEEAKEIQKCRKYVMRGEHDIGRVHAENAVRNHNQSLDLLALGARLQGAVNILQMAIVQNKVTSAMNSVVMSMGSATRTMNLPSLKMTMNRFERMTDHMSMSMACANQSLDDSGRGVSTTQVGFLMAQIVDRAGLDVKNEMPVVEFSETTSTSLPLSTSSMTDTGLDEKLAKLRNQHQ